MRSQWHYKPFLRSETQKNPVPGAQPRVLQRPVMAFYSMLPASSPSCKASLLPHTRENGAAERKQVYLLFPRNNGLRNPTSKEAKCTCAKRIKEYKLQDSEEDVSILQGGFHTSGEERNESGGEAGGWWDPTL